MKRKMATGKQPPNHSTTNGGNGSYMRRKKMTPKKGERYGKKEVDYNVAGVAPAVKRWMT